MNKLTIILSFFVITFFSCHDTKTNKSMSESDLELVESLIVKYQNGDTLGSLKGMKQFMNDFPNYEHGLNFLATLYIALNENSLAMENVQKALDINPNNHAALTNYGILLDRNSKYDEAYKVYKKAIAIKKDYTQAYSNLMGNRIAVEDINNARVYGELAVRYGNNVSDKGLLCAIYHNLELFDKRDSLYAELKKLNYKNLKQLEEIIL